MAQKHGTKLTLPKITSVILRNFSLFTRQSQITVAMSDGVSCLAGANGLGKSTFIAAINFGLTGRVPDPARKYESVNEYYLYTEDFSRKYFAGRISEADRASSEIEINFKIGGVQFRIVRGMFEPDQLRELEITEDGIKKEFPGTPTPSELQEIYIEEMSNQIGLERFEQFVFLQLFLFTFDERRHLVFWDDAVLQQILFLSFGFDPAMAKQADELSRRIEKEDSVGRNRNYQASETRKQLNEIQKFTSEQQEIDDDLQNRHRQLVEKRDSLRQGIDQTEQQLRDSKLRQAELSSNYTILQNEYEEKFTQRTSAKYGLHFHPLITESLNNLRCGLCGSKGSDVITAIEERISGTDCPLCGTPISPIINTSPNIDDLKIVDERMKRAKEETMEANRKLARLTKELENLTTEFEKTDSLITTFERENKKVPWSSALEAEKNIQALIQSYTRQIQKFLEQRDAARKRRDQAKQQLQILQRRLSDQYYEVEAEFVPLFRQLAHAFLGLDLNVTIEQRGWQMGLIVEVEGQVRRSLHELSESQRFFIDIALRMSLAQFLSSTKGKATMFIDTPEGSLDAAYESRAGEMFARFVGAGHPIIMTANINTSQLLLRLAKRCGTGKMLLSRMTEWTGLTEVQQAEERIFEQAYTSIEKALNGQDA